jgi:signal transduction histidine kinase
MPGMPQAPLAGGRFRLARKIVAAEVLLVAVEFGVCAPPLWASLRALPDAGLWTKILVPVLVAAGAASFFRLFDRVRLLSQQLALLERGEGAKALDGETAGRELAQIPRESALVHFILWTTLALVVAGVSFRSGVGTGQSAGALASLGVLLAAGAAATRLLIFARIMSVVRPLLMPQLQPVASFMAGYRGWFACAGLAMLGLGSALMLLMARAFLGVAAVHGVFIFWALVAVVGLAWWRAFLRQAAPIEQYFDSTMRARSSKGPARDDPGAVAAFQAAQRLPYTLSTLQAAGMGVAGALSLTWPRVLFDPTRRVSLMVAIMLLAGAVALYQRSLLQEILRPLVRHLGSRHALPPEQVRSPVGLRLKLAMNFVGVWGLGIGFAWLFLTESHGCAACVAFLVGIGLAVGLMALAIRDVVAPLSALEERSGEMSKGQLARPVPPWGEADELGRLAVIFEEMRRSLRDRLRSTESINVDLEREVRRRTEALEQRNAELHEALDKLRRAQDNLIRSEKLASMGRLVAGIAHEINNPVNAVINSLGPLEEAVKRIAEVDPNGEVGKLVEEATEILAVVQRGASRTKTIVQALHGYARGEETVERDVFLARSVDETLGLLQHRLRNVQVEKDVDPEARIRGYPGQIDQVLMNLFTNAAQAIGSKGGTIRVRAQKVDARVHLVVSDNGPGIPAEVLPRIFDPFFTTKDVGEGSGLGLSIVHGIIERHGGQIDVDSKPGQGTTFTISFPKPA